MSGLSDILSDGRIEALATSGYHVALRVGFAFPKFERNTFPRAWVRQYTQRGYMLDDPITRWVYAESGVIRWSALPGPDPREVLAAARQHDLVFGAAVSVNPESKAGIRSYGSFARWDREFTDLELTELDELMRALHSSSFLSCELTAAELETLQLLASGLIMKEIAYKLGISESAVKQRLASAKSKMSARTTTQAVMQATQLGWLG